MKQIKMRSSRWHFTVRTPQRLSSRDHCWQQHRNLIVSNDNNTEVPYEMKRRKESPMIVVVFFCLVFVSIQQCSAWVGRVGVQHPLVYHRRRPTTTTTVVRSSSPSNNPNDSSTNDDVDDDDCDDEEECEIDWSAMPTSDSSSTSTTSSSSATTTSQSNTATASPTPSPEQQRRRLEMNWTFQATADECDVYEPVTCGSNPCMTCRGAGQSSCRFCGGSRRIQLVSPHRLPAGGATLESSLSESSTTCTSVMCNVCSGSGQEVCRECAGTGWIADFAGMGMRAGTTSSRSSSSSSMGDEPPSTASP